MINCLRLKLFKYISNSLAHSYYNYNKITLLKLNNSKNYSNFL